jgi:hypothetical protein
MTSVHDYATEARTNPPQFTLRLLQVKQALERLDSCLSFLLFGNGKAKTADIVLSSKIVTLCYIGLLI